MNNFNTIDQFIECLEKTYHKPFIYEPVQYDRLDLIPDLTQKIDDEFYHFGVLTLGENFGPKENNEEDQEEQKIKKATFYNNNSKMPFISILPNSQIFDFFKLIHVRDINDDLIEPQENEIYGHFRGYKVYPSDKKIY